MADIGKKVRLAKTKARVVKSKVKKAVRGLEPIQTTTFTTGERGETAATAVSWNLRKNIPDDTQPSGDGKRGVTNWDSRMKEAPYDPDSSTSQTWGVKSDNRRGRHAGPPTTADDYYVKLDAAKRNRPDHFDTGRKEGK